MSRFLPGVVLGLLLGAAGASMYGLHAWRSLNSAEFENLAGQYRFDMSRAARIELLLRAGHVDKALEQNRGDAWLKEVYAERNECLARMERENRFTFGIDYDLCRPAAGQTMPDGWNNPKLEEQRRRLAESGLIGRSPNR